MSTFATAAPVTTTNRRVPFRGRGRRSPRWVTPALIGTALAASLPGLPYYLAPVAERVRHPMHAWLKPSGYVGQAAGILALLMFLFLWIYPLRKRVRMLSALGRLPRWLDVHIVIGLTVPIIGAMHAGWRFTGLIGLGYAAMLCVSLSGIVGRYLYTHIPRSRDGLELTREQVEGRRRDLIRGIADRLMLDETLVAAAIDAVLNLPEDRGVVRSLIALPFADIERWRAERRLRAAWRAEGVGAGLDHDEIRAIGRMVRKEIALSQQMRLLEATRSVFKFWHVAHMPVAITALGAVLVHVAVVVVLGVTWLW